jgi:GT2 family glycosyltransferase
MNPTPKRSKPERVSIVSAVDDHPPDLQLRFQALNSQTLPADLYEVIVVDATHQVDCQAALMRFRAGTEMRADISCHRVERGGRALALNRAVELATGNLVIFLGDDFVPPPEFAEAHLRLHRAHPEAEAVGIGSALLIPALRTPFSVWLEESGQLFGVPFRADMTSVPEDFFYVGNASVKRELLERAGRFDERFAHHAWDDLEFGLRLRAAGMKSQFVPDARADHVHRIDLNERERSVRYAGAAARVYITDHVENSAWFKTASLPSWLHWLRATAARMRLAVARNDDALIYWWKARLDAAFAAGYRHGAR